MTILNKDKRRGIQSRGNCPFCDDIQGYHNGWGFSPEGWEAVRKAHDKYHACPTR